MNYVFWGGIAIGFILSIVASIIANLYIDAVRSVIDRANVNLKNSRRKKEKSTYLRIRGFKEGKENENVFFLHSAMATLLFMLFFSGFFSTALVMLYIADKSGIKFNTQISLFENLTDPIIKNAFGPAFLLIFSGMISAWIGILRLREFMSYWRRTRKFEEYQKDLEKRWGTHWYE